MRNLLLSFAALAALAATPAAATVLTFDIDNSKPNASLSMSQAYGDRVTATVQNGATYGVGAEGFTPNVLASYSGGTAGSLIRWTTNYGDLVNVLENEVDGASVLEVTLTADAGYQVNLYGFDLGGWPQFDYTLPGLQVVDRASNVLFSQSNVLVQGNGVGPRHTTIDFGAGLSGQSLTLRLNLAGLNNNSDNIGLDIVRFGQSGGPVAGVPVPSACALMIAGFAGGGAALRRRRVAPAV